MGDAKTKTSKKFNNLSARLKKMPPCGVGLEGWCCKNCLMGPCRLVKEGDRGVCGATKEVVVARNILRFVAGGASAHTGHAYHFLSYLGKQYPVGYIKKNAPYYLHKLWDKLGIVPKIKLEHFKDISEALHASTMGVNADYKDLLAQAMKLGVLDGYYGMYLATELEDKYYGKPKPKKGIVDLGVIDSKKINIAVHGHEPMLAETLAKEVAKAQNKDINLIGVCCTGASLLARHDIPLAANVILQEDVIATGAIEVLVVDVQCVMPSLADLAECYHTKIITTSELAKIPGALHLPVKDEKSAVKVAKQIIKIARENKKKRKVVKISKSKKEAITGFTEYNMNLQEISRQIKNKKIKGIIAVIGCINPRVGEVNEHWTKLFAELSKNYLIITTGCRAFEFAKAGLMDGKNFFHLGSCVNNSRVAEVFKRIADMNKKQITDLPFLVSCPTPMTEKAIAIGFFFASLGVDVHFGYPFMFKNDKKIADFLGNLLRDVFKSKIFLEQSPQIFLKRLKEEGLSISKSSL